MKVSPARLAAATRMRCCLSHNLRIVYKTRYALLEQRCVNDGENFPDYFPKLEASLSLKNKHSQRIYAATVFYKIRKVVCARRF